ncbi:orotidine-5'-phosphate decarboxylase, partial [Candidatus Woesearchaeota archaeon]|nr:orotidine-5'-phosphate decarboxylase [Candidatus Woesearchaeota archaeon]
CVGIDPRLGPIPEEIKERAINLYGNTIAGVVHAYREFCYGVVDAVADIAPVAKPQFAFFEKLGAAGFALAEDVVQHAQDHGLLVITDAKRNDIGSTAEAYADAFLGRTELFDGQTVPVVDADAMTVNAYLGTDGVKPFVKRCADFDKGIFCLVKTSNPSSGELQDLEAKFAGNTLRIYEHMARLVDAWGQELRGESGYSSVGAVTGATYPEHLGVLRELMPHAILLIPGYGAQGGTADDVPPGFNPDGLGAIVNSSRGVIFAYTKDEYKNMNWKDAIRKAALDATGQINISLEGAKKLPPGWK